MKISVSDVSRCGLAYLLASPALFNPAAAAGSDTRVLGADLGGRRGLRAKDATLAPMPALPVAGLPTPVKVAAPSPTNLNVTGFVRPAGTAFAVDGAPYYFGGTNDFSAAQVDLYTDAQVQAMMQAHAAKGARVIRFFAFSNGDGAGNIPTPQPIQPTVGSFDEVALKRLDLVIAAAAQNGMRVIMPLVNYEPALGGMQWYVDNIIGVGQDKELFYTDPRVAQAYKAYVSLLVNRVNTVTGVPYKNDPAIMAWELSNEVHTSDLYEKNRGMVPGQMCNTWLSEMSTYIKSLGISQMVSTGEEGYRADGDTTCCDNSWINGGFKGVDFVANINLPNIDFATVHYYPDNWKISPSDYASYSRYFLSDRASIAHSAGKPALDGKPIIIEETGLGGLNGFTGVDRDTFLGTIYSIADGQGFAGEMVWQVWPEGSPNMEGYNFAYDQSGGAAMTSMYRTMAQTGVAASPTG